MPDGFIAGRGGDAICGPFNSPPEKQCTCLAWERRRDVYDTAVARGVPAGGPRLPGYYVWDGGQWLVNAQRAGIPTGPHPVAGALVVWGYPNTASYGHVAYVEQADSDTHVLVTECNYDWLGHCHTIWMNPQSQGRLQGYIYGGPAGNGPGTNTGGGTTSAPPPPPAGLNAWPYPIQPERTLRADFDGDGKADVAAFYAYNNAETGLWVWRSTSAPSALSFARPERPWDSGPGNWDWSRGKYFVGDFNGDGKADVGALYRYDNGEEGLWVWRSTSSPGTISFAAPVRVWDSGPGNWDGSRAMPIVGDFDGDGKADVGAFYRYDNSETGLWTWRSTSSPGSITFDPPHRVWDSGPGNWDGSRVLPFAGDFDGDGKADVGTLYRYDNSETGLWTWHSTSAPGSVAFAPPQRVWDSGPGNWDGSRAMPFVGDFDGDGKADVGALYRYDNNDTGLWTWRSNGTGFDLPTRDWDSGSGNWDWTRTLPMPGDFDGDGKTDLAALYTYDNAEERLWAWRASGTGTIGFSAPTVMWDSGAGNWDGSRGAPG